jgi:methylated-DNA-protein-cysteine methyltransferase-like protein
MPTIFTHRTREIIARIPYGKVTTYGIIASCAGSRSGARQVARILHSSSGKYDLPWHRVVNREGRISLPRGNGFELQYQLLHEEGIVFNAQGIIEFATHLWLPP